MKNINISISDEAHKRLRIYQALKDFKNQSTAIDTLVLETLPPMGNPDDN